LGQKRDNGRHWRSVKKRQRETTDTGRHEANKKKKTNGRHWETVEKRQWIQWETNVRPPREIGL
jgi:hypothetical protein